MDKNRITVKSLIEYYLPNGSRGAPGDWQQYPRWPPDLFAVTASLVQRTDGYTYLLTDNAVRETFFIGQGAGNGKCRPPYESRKDLKIGAKWRSLDNFQNSFEENELQRWWTTLRQSTAELTNLDAHTEWLAYALLLMIVADEACAGMGFLNAKDKQDEDVKFKGNDRAWIPVIYYQLNQKSLSVDEFIDQRQSNWCDTPWQTLEKRLIDEVHRPTFDTNGASQNPDQSSIYHSACILVPPQLVCVQPKTRTPVVGCTLRSMTHNIALLPPAGEVKVRWHQHIEHTRSNHKTFNILFYPYPITVSGNDFKAARSTANDYGYFSVCQSWLNRTDDADRDPTLEPAIDRLFNKIKALIHSAKNHVKQVDMILLPELALNQVVYDGLFSRLLSLYKSGAETPTTPNILVAGVARSEIRNDVTQHFNSAITSMILGESNHAHYASSDALNYIQVTQNKHHRWMLDDRQIRAYSLGDALDPSVKWWEDIAIDRREVNTIAFRSGACFTTLVCEDLARIDPCQSVIRAIGPNLVIALLMDGPQLSSRWPGRYAMGLSDDPGCSVLSVTSLGLLDRSNHYAKKRERSVALWRDCRGQTEELLLPEGSEALLLTLTEKKGQEISLDGRDDGETAFSWLLSGSVALTSPSKERRKTTVGTVLPANIEQ